MLLTLFAALLCLLIGQLLFTLSPPATSSVAVLLGAVLHVLGGGLAWLSFRSEAGSETEGVPSRRTQLIAIAAIVVLAGLLRFVWLETLPFRIDGDAAAFAASADDFLRPDPPSLIGVGWQSHTNVYLFLESRVLWLFGYTAFGLRFFGALGGTLGVLAIYALGRSLWNFWVGFWAALITAVLPFHLVFSRVGTEVIHVTWLLPLAAWSIWQGWRRNDWRWFLLSGLTIGLSQYFYPGARLIPILAVAQIGLLTLFPPEGDRSWRRGGWGLLWLIVGVLAIYGPMIPFFIRKPEIYSARITIVSIFSSGWLAQQLEQRPWWSVLFTQLRDAYLPFFVPLKGPAIWFVWPQYLGPFDAALFALGLIGVWVGRQTPRWLKLFLAIYLLLGMFLAGVLTIDTPMPSRYVIFVPGVALAAGYALDRLIQALRRPAAQRPLKLGLAMALTCLYLGINISNYLKHDTEAIWEIDHTGQMATYAARYLQTLPDQDFEIFFLQTELMYYEASPVLAFLTDKPGNNIKKEFTCDVVTNVVRKPHTVFIAPEQRLGELQAMNKRLSMSKLEVLSTPQNTPVVGVLEVWKPVQNALLCLTSAED
ncbi:MAG TPA: glycosyltransferase family 39 protein [Herpetosiphonaceae bacterium]